MFGLFSKNTSRIKTEGNDIFVNNKNGNIGKTFGLDFVFDLLQPMPEIKVFENDVLSRCYKIETLTQNPDLTGQFLHSSIRVSANSAVMIDGIVSKSNTIYPRWTDDNYEAIRLQPFYLSDKNEINDKLIGKGLFERGLHFSGTVTPSSVRNICICDKCTHSFTIQHFHAGFSYVQYFYSSDSTETLIVPYNAIGNLPVQLQEPIDNATLDVVEALLPCPSNGIGAFRYCNPFRCPHCSFAFIDFENNKAMRANEYYGNVYINMNPRYWPEKNKV